MDLFQRVTAKTPSFFRKLRNVSLTIAAVGTAIVTVPVALPAAIVSAAGYLIAIGTAGATIAQLTTETEKI